MGVYDEKKVARAIRNTDFISDGKKYVMVKLDKKDYSAIVREIADISDEYIEIIKDINEVSLMVL